MSIHDLALFAGLIFAFALISRRIEGTIVTAPMIAVTAGVVLGPQGTQVIQLDFGAGLLHGLAEITLALVLFGDATRIDVRALSKNWGLPSRLLGLALPLSIALGTVLARLFLPQLSWFEAATLAAVLAPTDAALGQAVVSSEKVPERIRQGLNVESGLNDGIALPFVLLFASLGSIGLHSEKSTGDWLLFVAQQIGLGLIGGVAIALAGAFLIDRAVKAGHVDHAFERIAGLALPIVCFAGAELIHGNGFLAAFAGGLAFGAYLKGRCGAMLVFLEAEGQLLMLLVFLGLGAGISATAIESSRLTIIIYAGLSLTVIRMAPVSLSLIGTHLRAPSHLFVGWFGPRGLASLLYAILLLEEFRLPNETLIFTTIMIAVTLSVFLHGVSAAPGVGWYSRRSGDQEACPAEHRSEDMGLRTSRK